jgi:ATP-binding cassette subfamily B (MDR/TAP) protein 1
MKQLSFNVTYGCVGIMVSTVIGNMLTYHGFGTASERVNKRVRDAAYNSMVRQEVGFFDLRPVGTITSQLEDDAALLHSFSGEPIRTLIMSLAKQVRVQLSASRKTGAQVQGFNQSTSSVLFSNSTLPMANIL